MRRLLKWVCGPAVLSAALVLVPSGEAAAQSFSYYYGSPGVSFGFSSGYYGPWAGPVVPYGGYYGRRAYGPYPYCGPPWRHHGYHHGYHHGFHQHHHGYPGPGYRHW